MGKKDLKLGMGKDSKLGIRNDLIEGMGNNLIEGMGKKYSKQSMGKDLKDQNNKIT